MAGGRVVYFSQNNMDLVRCKGWAIRFHRNLAEASYCQIPHFPALLPPKLVDTGGLCQSTDDPCVGVSARMRILWNTSELKDKFIFM